MKSVLATCLALGVLAVSAAQAQNALGEGRVRDAQPAAPDASRVSKYLSGPSEKGLPTRKSTQAAAKVEEKIYRAAETLPSGRAAYFEIYDAGHTLFDDRDGDGYHRDFRIRFDADASFGDALVYAKLYIRRVGDSGNWQLYHETDDFWIYGESDADDYYVDTVLDDGFPTSEYDILVDLYEVGYSGIVATIGPWDDNSLGYLPLEEVGLDAPFGLAGYRINDIASTLLSDRDGDGYHSRYEVTFDPDTDFGSAWVYAVVWVRSQGGEWIEEHESDDFQVDISGTADVYSFTAEWISGYPTGRYDVQIDLHDAATGILVASAGSDWPELSRLPLEDEARDQLPNSPGPGGGGSTSSHEHGGGGSMTWVWMAMLMGLGVMRFAPGLMARRIRGKGNLTRNSRPQR